MDKRKRKHQKNHVIIVTSDAVDAQAKQIRVKSWLVQVLMIVGCIVLGAALGCFIYEQRIWDTANKKIDEQKEIVSEREEEIVLLKEEIDRLEEEIVQRDDKIEILSETVNQKTASEEDLLQILKDQATPSRYPLTGSASIEENTAQDPACVFTAAKDTTVVATASGTVMAINDDAEYGHSVWIDHGNGYKTIYRNPGEPNVKLGDQVASGTTIYIIGDENTKVCYQIRLDENYIDPMDMLTISG